MEKISGVVRIAFDIGGVLGDNLGQRRNEDGTYRVTPPKLGSIDTVIRLCQKLGPTNIFVISRVCKEARIVVNRDLLAAWNFQALTGVPDTNIIVFAGERDEKADYVKQFDITHMVDDRVEVLVRLPLQVHMVAFNPNSEEMEEFRQKLGDRNLTIVYDWYQLAAMFGV